jgi:hypothetical protein
LSRSPSQWLIKSSGVVSLLTTILRGFTSSCTPRSSSCLDH